MLHSYLSARKTLLKYGWSHGISSCGTWSLIRQGYRQQLWRYLRLSSGSHIEHNGNSYCVTRVEFSLHAFHHVQVFGCSTRSDMNKEALDAVGIVFSTTTLFCYIFYFDYFLSLELQFLYEMSYINKVLLLLLLLLFREKNKQITINQKMLICYSTQLKNLTSCILMCDRIYRVTLSSCGQTDIWHLFQDNKRTNCRPMNVNTNSCLISNVPLRKFFC